MRDSRYTRETSFLMSQTRTTVAYYNETAIINNTRINIVVIDHNNVKKVIPGRYEVNGLEQVTLYNRCDVEKTLEFLIEYHEIKYHHLDYSIGLYYV